MVYIVVITAILLVIAYDIWREEKLYRQGKELISKMRDLDG